MPIRGSVKSVAGGGGRTQAAMGGTAGAATKAGTWRGTGGGAAVTLSRMNFAKQWPQRGESWTRPALGNGLVQKRVLNLSDIALLKSVISETSRDSSVSGRRAKLQWHLHC